MHEQSETVKDERTGKWVNIYGRNTPKAGQRLPGDREYNTMEEAVAAAKKRSEDYGRKDGPATRKIVPY